MVNKQIDINQKQDYNWGMFRGDIDYYLKYLFFLTLPFLMLKLSVLNGGSYEPN